MAAPSKTSAEIAAEEYANQVTPHDVAISMMVSEVFLTGAQWALTHSPEVQGLRGALNRLNISSLHNISRYDDDGDVECTPYCTACNVIKALAAFDVATRGLK